MKKLALICVSVLFLSGAAIISASADPIHPNGNLTVTNFSAAVRIAPGDDGEASQPQRSFSGVVVSLNGARFVLRDDDANTWYHLDDQDAVKPYLGKKVVITGTLDARSDMIHVQKISQA